MKISKSSSSSSREFEACVIAFMPHTRGSSDCRSSRVPYQSRPPIGVRRHGQANQEERTSVRETRVEGTRGGIGGVCDVLCQRKRKRG